MAELFPVYFIFNFNLKVFGGYFVICKRVRQVFEHKIKF